MRLDIHLLQGAFAGFFFGTSAIFIRLMPGFSPLTITFYRLTLAFLLLALARVLLGPRTSARRSGHMRGASIMLGSLLGIHVLLFTWSVKLTSILNATILVNTTPVWAMIMGYVLTRRLPRPIAVAGTFTAIGGVAVIGAAQAAYSPGGLSGDLLALLAAVVWGIYLTAGGSALRGQSPLALLPGIYGGASISVLLIILLNGGPLELPSSLELAPLIGISLFPTALGHSLQFSALKGLTPHGAATLALLEPAVATTLGALFLSEIPRLEFLLGAALTTFGIYLVVSRRE